MAAACSTSDTDGSDRAEVAGDEGQKCKRPSDCDQDADEAGAYCVEGRCVPNWGEDGGFQDYCGTNACPLGQACLDDYCVEIPQLPNCGGEPLLMTAFATREDASHIEAADLDGDGLDEVVLVSPTGLSVISEINGVAQLDGDFGGVTGVSRVAVAEGSRDELLLATEERIHRLSSTMSSYSLVPGPTPQGPGLAGVDGSKHLDMGRIAWWDLSGAAYLSDLTGQNVEPFVLRDDLPVSQVAAARASDDRADWYLYLNQYDVGYVARTTETSSRRLALGLPGKVIPLMSANVTTESRAVCLQAPPLEIEDEPYFYLVSPVGFWNGESGLIEPIGWIEGSAGPSVSADIDADGTDEVVVAVGENILVIRSPLDPDRACISVMPTVSGGDVLQVASGDVSGNGRESIFALGGDGVLYASP